MIMQIPGGLWSLVIGMVITIKKFFKKPVTVQYPHEALKMPPRFRGHIELKKDENGNALCYACNLCAKACPSDCIIVEGIKPEGSRKKTVSKYILDFTKCSLCGECIEACRDPCIEFSGEYNLVSQNKDDFVIDLFQRLKDQSDDYYGPEKKPEDASLETKSE